MLSAGLPLTRPYLLHAYADGNVVDTAVDYRGGASEQIAGALLHGRPEPFVLSTKHRHPCGGRVILSLRSRSASWRCSA
jgi:aryl-alcohol dehydrogenase-like predicted oxidoreductase